MVTRMTTTTTMVKVITTGDDALAAAASAAAAAPATAAAATATAATATATTTTTTTKLLPPLLPLGIEWYYNQHHLANKLLQKEATSKTRGKCCCSLAEGPTTTLAGALGGSQSKKGGAPFQPAHLITTTLGSYRTRQLALIGDAQNFDFRSKERVARWLARTGISAQSTQVSMQSSFLAFCSQVQPLEPWKSKRPA